MTGILEWLAVIAVCLVGFGTITMWFLTRPGGALAGVGAALRQTVFLFDGADLLDATSRARILLGAGGNAGNLTDWEQLRASVLTRFPDFPRQPPAQSSASAIRLVAADPGDDIRLSIEQLDGITRVALDEVAATSSAHARPEMEPYLRQIERDVATLRPAIENAPYPAWQIGDDGRVNWHNPAYEDVFRKVHGTAPVPTQRLFPAKLLDKPGGSKLRASLGTPENAAMLWFDIHVVRTDTMRLFYAIDINAVVSAEVAQRNFVQTLAKTFAQLSTGLAIFDRNRQLALFNPALIDLTALSAEFLSARPNLLSFFDRLRNNSTMPEPKNYGGWRDQIADLVAAAAQGSYSETWTLPNGSTYRVTGRPHPDGAVAFLFEDISAEISLTRRFRAELELNQTIFDRIEPAIAVFSRAGALYMANRSYSDLWGHDPDTMVSELNILDATVGWQAQCAPSAIWGEMRDFVRGNEEQAEWSAELKHRQSGMLRINVQPLPGERTLISFRPLDSVAGQVAQIPHPMQLAGE